MKSLNVFGFGGYGAKGKYENALDLSPRGLIDTSRMLTHRFPFKKAFGAFEAAQEKMEGNIEVASSD